MIVSLLVAYRKRPQHLKEFLSHFRSSVTLDDLEIILIEGDEQSELEPQEWDIPNLKYKFVPMSGDFHKTKLLNIGLSLASGDFVIPYDVDLLPLKDSISVGLQIARSSPQVLVTGYRLMSNVPCFDHNLQDLGIAPEDSHSALRKQMLSREKFGVCPFFSRSKLLKIGGWNERYVGWGAEDQDIIDRYCGREIHLARFPNLVYVHLDHDVTPGWNDPEFLQRNRKIYYEALASREG